MKAKACIYSLLIFASVLSQSEVRAADRTYGVHLFFDEKEFVDVLTLDLSAKKGHMVVPHDFEGEIEDLVTGGGKIAFNLKVPRNASRPSDLVFHYEGSFFDGSDAEIAGFVTLKDTHRFIASFLGFARN